MCLQAALNIFFKFSLINVSDFFSIHMHRQILILMNSHRLCAWVCLNAYMGGCVCLSECVCVCVLVSVCPLQCNVRCVHRGQQHVTASHMTLSGTRDRAALQSLPPSPTLPPSLPPPLQLHLSPFPAAFFCLWYIYFFPFDLTLLQLSVFLDIWFFSNTPPTLYVSSFMHFCPFFYSSLCLTLCALLVPAVDRSKITSFELTEKKKQQQKNNHVIKVTQGLAKP